MSQFWYHLKSSFSFIQYQRLRHDLVKLTISYHTFNQQIICYNHPETRTELTDTVFVIWTVLRLLKEILKCAFSQSSVNSKLIVNIVHNIVSSKYNLGLMCLKPL